MQSKAVEIELFAPAKVNLLLRVVGRLPSGYHRIRSFIAPISLGETVSVSWKEEPGVEVRVSLEPALERFLHGRGAVLELLNSPQNIAARAAQMFFEALPFPRERRQKGVVIEIQKRVPLGAGLGGGSADAAGTLSALNQALGSPLSFDALCEIGGRVGSDVPPLLHGLIRGGACFVYGTGSQILPVSGCEQLKGIGLVVVMGPETVSTAEAYRGLEAAPCSEGGKERPWEEAEVVEFCQAVGGRFLPPGLTTAGGEANSREPNLLEILGRFSNDFEPVAHRLAPSTAAVAEAVKRAGADRVMLTGSGAAVVGYCASVDQAQAVAERLAAEQESAKEETDEWFISPARFFL